VALTVVYSCNFCLVVTTKQYGRYNASAVDC